MSSVGQLQLQRNILVRIRTNASLLLLLQVLYIHVVQLILVLIPDQSSAIVSCLQRTQRIIQAEKLYLTRNLFCWAYVVIYYDMICCICYWFLPLVYVSDCVEWVYYVRQIGRMSGRKIGKSYRFLGFWVLRQYLSRVCGPSVFFISLVKVLGKRVRSIPLISTLLLPVFLVVERVGFDLMRVMSLQCGFWRVATGMVDAIALMVILLAGLFLCFCDFGVGTGLEIALFASFIDR